MNREEYHAARRKRWKLGQAIAARIRWNDYADMRLRVQIDAENELLQNMRRERDAIPFPYCNRDPLGFRVMAENWKRRRSHVEYRVRCRRQGAARKARREAAMRERQGVSA